MSVWHHDTVYFNHWSAHSFFLPSSSPVFSKEPEEHFGALLLRAESRPPPHRPPLLPREKRCRNEKRFKKNIMSFIQFIKMTRRWRRSGCVLDEAPLCQSPDSHLQSVGPGQRRRPQRQPAQLLPGETGGRLSAGEVIRPRRSTPDD